MWPQKNKKMMLIAILLLCLTTTFVEAGTNNYNGTWQLDKSRSDSMEEMLKLMGVGSFKRMMMRNMDIRETYTVFHRSVIIKTVTPYSHEEDTYFFGVEQPKMDLMMGPGSIVVTRNTDSIHSKFVRGGDGAIYTLIREINPSFDAQLRITTSFIIPSQQQGNNISCVVYFKRM